MPEPRLEHWVTLIAAALAPLGFAREKRPFAPHVSLARVQQPSDLRAWKGRFDPKAPEWGGLEVTGFALYQTVAPAPPPERYVVRAWFAA